MKKIYTADTSQLGAIISRIRKESACLTLSEEDIDRLHIICDEFISNIINNAYSRDGEKTLLLDGIAYEKPLMIKCRKTANYLSVELTDWGRPFNPLEYSGVADQANRVGGFGILIAVNLADDIAYLRKDSMNILTVYIRAG